jgi:hypothetical protein
MTDNGFVATELDFGLLKLVGMKDGKQVTRLFAAGKEMVVFDGFDKWKVYTREGVTGSFDVFVNLDYEVECRLKVGSKKGNYGWANFCELTIEKQGSTVSRRDKPVIVSKSKTGIVLIKDLATGTLLEVVVQAGARTVQLESLDGRTVISDAVSTLRLAAMGGNLLDVDVDESGGLARIRTSEGWYDVALQAYGERVLLLIGR